jgi:excisionase family DNA binding protein
LVGDGKWLTVKEAVDRLEGLVSDSSVRRLCDEGKLTAIRLGGTRGDRRIRADSVAAYLAKLKAPKNVPKPEVGRAAEVRIDADSPSKTTSRPEAADPQA